MNILYLAHEGVENVEELTNNSNSDMLRIIIITSLAIAVLAFAARHLSQPKTKPSKKEKQ